MQAYNKTFARVYNLRWGGFAQNVAPRIREYYDSLPIAASNRRVLDVCCGTGQMALHFLENGYRVTGIDLSEAMLRHARENTARFVETGQAQFIRANATSFALAQQFGLIVSIFDALNHLEDETALKSCFQCVSAALANGGVFIFDLNTRAGLDRWNGIHVDDTREAMIVTRGLYEPTLGRAYTRLSGFICNPDGFYERFEETAFNTAFDMQQVREILLDAGWSHVHFARLPDLSAPIDEPEREGRVFFVASR